MKSVYRVLISMAMLTWVMLLPIRAAAFNLTERLEWKSNLSTKQVENADLEKVKPTLTAAINDGVLSIQAIDQDSGIAAIYVNSYEYTKLDNGSLNIRLQQFDTGYQYFSLQAKDQAGNASDLYRLKNPYYIDQALEKDKKDMAVELKEALPISAVATNPTDAKGTIIGHTQMVAVQTIEGDTGEAAIEKVETEVVESQAVETEVVETIEGAGKEFYTIQTKSDKVFYLIIDKSQQENNVYLLTEVSENDLLNFNKSQSEVLPKNSAVVDAAIPISNNVSVNEESDGSVQETAVTNVGVDDNQDNATEAVNPTESKPVKPSNKGNYIMIGIVVLVVGGVGVYTKLIKGKKERYEDEDFEEEEEEYEKEDQLHDEYPENEENE